MQLPNAENVVLQRENQEMRSMFGALVLAGAVGVLSASGCTNLADTQSTSTGSFEATVRVTDQVLNTVNPLIFGDNIEWTNNGMGMWLPEQNKFDERLLDEIRQAGVTHLRYPGGTLSDYFDWHKAVGEKRVPVPNCWSDPTPGEPQYPHFGPDEFMDLCRKLGISGTITLNSGTGTPEDAVAWIKYCRDRDFNVTAYAVGNELYLEEHKQTVPGMPIAKTADEYADFCLRIAEAVNEFAPEINLGVIGTTDFPEWTKTVLQKAGDKIDFLTIHNGYAPMLRTSGFTPDSRIYPEELFVKSFAGASQSVAGHISQAKRWIEEYTPNKGKDVDLHMTEYGPLVYPFGDESRLLEDLMWNRTLLAALFQATEFNVFLKEPKLTSANHLPLCQGGFGALFAFSGEYPNRIVWRNVVYYVFQMYSALACREVLETEIEAPTYSARATGNVERLRGVPYIDAGAYQGDNGTSLNVFLINRDMKRTASVNVNLGFSPFEIQSITRLTADSYKAENTPKEPDHVVPVTETINETREGTSFTIQLPKHSLAKVDIKR